MPNSSDASLRGPVDANLLRIWVRQCFSLLGAVALALLVSAPCTAQTSSRFRFDQKLGTYSVGLRVVQQYDRSRTWGPTVDNLGKPIPGRHERPLQTLIWYPATRSTAPVMTVADYVRLLYAETNFDHPQLWMDWQDWVTGLHDAMQDPSGPCVTHRPRRAATLLSSMLRVSVPWRGRTSISVSFSPVMDTSFSPLVRSVPTPVP